MVVFSLSYVVDSCYKHGLLVTLSKGYTVEKKKQVSTLISSVMFSYGYKEDIMGTFLADNYHPQVKVLS